MDKKQIKTLEEAYDKLYNANSSLRYPFNDLMQELEDYAESKGYRFKLNNRDKFKLVVNK